MLVTSSIYKKLLQIIPLLSSRFAHKFDGKIEGKSLGKRPSCFPSAIQIFSNATSRIRSCRNQQRNVVITAITLPVVFATVAQAQLSPTLKAQESAAKQYVAAMNKAQQAYYAKNRGFTSYVSNLDLRIKPDTAHYKYSIEISPPQYLNREIFVFNYATPNQVYLRGWVGGVLSRGNKIQTILCVTFGTGTPVSPTISSGGLACGVGMRKISE